jgi:hypothetical protein
MLILDGRFDDARTLNREDEAGGDAHGQRVVYEVGRFAGKADPWPLTRPDRPSQDSQFLFKKVSRLSKSQTAIACIPAPEKCM